MFPKGKAEGALFVTEATEQLSPVVGIPKVNPVAVQAVLVVVIIAAGAVIVGFSESDTVSTLVSIFENKPEVVISSAIKYSPAALGVKEVDVD